MQKNIRKFKLGKLVRDKIVEGIIKTGNNPHFHKLNKSDYINELKKKVLEEASEFPKAKNKKELAEEIADLQEIIDNLLEVLKISKTGIAKLQKEKNKKRGSFKKRLYIDTVEVINNSEWVKYYLANPEKFPEIK